MPTRSSQSKRILGQNYDGLESDPRLLLAVGYMPNTVPFAFIGTPHLYQNDAPSSFPNLYYPPSRVSSVQTALNSATTTPELREICNISHPRTFDFNITGDVATRQIPCLTSEEELSHGQSASPASGPIRGASQKQCRSRRRKTLYLSSCVILGDIKSLPVRARHGPVSGPRDM